MNLKLKLILIIVLNLLVSKANGHDLSSGPTIKIISLCFPEPLNEALLKCHETVSLNETLWVEFPASFRFNDKGYLLEEFVFLAHQNGFEIERMRAERILIAPSELGKKMHVLMTKIEP